MVDVTGRAKIETVSADLKHKYGLLESALSTVLRLLLFDYTVSVLFLWSYGYYFSSLI